MRGRRTSAPTVAVVGGVVAAVSGLVLLLSPPERMTAHAGSPLVEPSAAVTTPGPGESSALPVGPSTSPATTASVDPSVDPSVDAARGTAVPAAGFVPDRLVVSALSVDAALVTTLVDPDGALVPPEDPSRLGWWRGVRPGGGAGSVVVAGHLDSYRYGRGPLARLVELLPGDRATLLGPDGAVAEYEVRGVETFDKDSLPAAALFGTDGAERLVLVTCGGTFDRRLGRWDSNVVAVLDPVRPG